MVNQRYAEAMSEVLLYLKGIRKEDTDKIPKEFMNFLKKNASKDYKCDFDYTKPLKELNLKKETIGLIDMIYQTYWCETKEEQKVFQVILNENERRYQDELRKKYNPDDIFKDKKATTVKSKIQKETDKEDDIVPYEENIIKKIINKIVSVFRGK